MLIGDEEARLLHGKDIKVLSMVLQSIVSPREALLVAVREVLVVKSCKNGIFCCGVDLHEGWRQLDVMSNSHKLNCNAIASCLDLCNLT